MGNYHSAYFPTTRLRPARPSTPTSAAAPEVVTHSIGWAIKDERDFLRNIGLHSAGLHDRNMLLLLYREAMSLRRNWCGMAPAAIQAEVDFLIQNTAG